MIFSEVSKWAVVFGLFSLQSTGGEVMWSPLVTEFGLCSCLLSSGGVAVMVIDILSSGSSAL